MDILSKIQTKRVYVEAKKSANFQTYTVGYDIDLVNVETDEEIESIIKLHQAKCRKLCQDQITLDNLKR